MCKRLCGLLFILVQSIMEGDIDATFIDKKHIQLVEKLFTINNVMC